MKKEQGKLAVFVQPNARKNEITAIVDGTVHIKIAAPPVKGKANKELIRYLSDVLDIGKNCLDVQKGGSSRRKLINIGSIGEALALKKIQTLLGEND